MPGPLYMLNKCLIISIMDMYSWKRTWKWSASIFSFYKYDNEPREKWWLKQSKSEIKYHVWNSTVQSPSSSTVVSLISLLFCIISITLFPILSLSLSQVHTRHCAHLALQTWILSRYEKQLQLYLSIDIWQWWCNYCGMFLVAAKSLISLCLRVLY